MLDLFIYSKIILLGIKRLCDSQGGRSDQESFSNCSSILQFKHCVLNSSHQQISSCFSDESRLIQPLQVPPVSQPYPLVLLASGWSRKTQSPTQRRRRAAHDVTQAAQASRRLQRAREAESNKKTRYSLWSRQLRCEGIWDVVEGGRKISDTLKRVQTFPPVICSTLLRFWRVYLRLHVFLWTLVMRNHSDVSVWMREDLQLIFILNLVRSALSYL